MEQPTDRDVQVSAFVRYLNDTRFHVIVDTAVKLATQDIDGQPLREDEVPLRAAAVALVLAENDARQRCPACGTGQVDAATIGERDPRYVPACTCDQEPYQ